MFNLSMPYNNNHPLFRLEVRRIRWGKSPRQLRRYSLWAIVFIVLVLSVLGFLSVSEWNRSSRYLILDDLFSFIIPLFYVSILANFILDIACFAFTLNSMDVRERKTWWDMLRLTPAGVQNVIPVKHTVAQIRAWRVMMVVVGMRITAVVLMLLYLVANWIISPIIMDFEGILLISVMVVFGVTYLLESVWRMRAMTALGLWISAQASNAALAGLAGFGMIIGVWISQAIIMGFLVWITLTSVTGDAFFFEILVMCVITALVIYNYYRLLGETSLNHALRNALSA